MTRDIRTRAERTAVVTAFALVAALPLVACNTVEGVGEDITSVGRAVGDERDDGVYAAHTTVMRAGPSRDFPTVDTVSAGAAINVHGCLVQHDWCDVSWGPNRGWLRAEDIDYFERGHRSAFGAHGNPSTVTLSFGYWDSNYRDRPWYRDRAEWAVRFRSDG